MSSAADNNTPKKSSDATFILADIKTGKTVTAGVILNVDEDPNTLRQLESKFKERGKLIEIERIKVSEGIEHFNILVDTSND